VSSLNLCSMKTAISIRLSQEHCVNSLPYGPFCREGGNECKKKYSLVADLFGWWVMKGRIAYVTWILNTLYSVFDNTALSSVGWLSAQKSKNWIWKGNEIILWKIRIVILQRHQTAIASISMRIPWLNRSIQSWCILRCSLQRRLMALLLSSETRCLSQLCPYPIV